MFNKILVAVGLLAASLSVHAATNRPSGYTTICKVGETCSVSQSTNVAFGASGQFVYKVLNGSFSCSVSTFGSDPIPSKSVKECSIPSNGSSSSGSSSSSSSSSSGSSSGGGCGSGGGSTVCLSASGSSNGINLSWSVSGSISSVQLYRDTDSNPSGRTRIASVSSSTTSFSDTGAASGTTYYYWVKYYVNGTAYNSGVASAVRGSSSSSSSSSSSTSSSSGGKGSSCSSTGSQSVSSTIKVTSGTYDGRCKTFNPTSALGDGSQSESQKPAFRVENGATLKNVIIGNNGVDGIHVYNGGTLNNILWTNVGEDAMTVKSEGNVTVTNVEGYDGEDKFIQVNAVTNLKVSNCIVNKMGKFLRQNGGKTFAMSVSVDNCDISNMGEGIFRSDSPNATAVITNSRLRNAGDICIGAWKSCKSSNISSF